MILADYLSSQRPHLNYQDSYRDNSQDRVAVSRWFENTVFVVADGVGGKAGGGEAADAAVDRIARLVLNDTRRGGHRWQTFVEALDVELAERVDCGETTLVVVEVTAKKLWGVSVGDSEAWLVLPGGHYDLTGSQVGKPYLGSGGAIITPFQIKNPGAGTLVVATDGLFKYASPSQIETAALLPYLPDARERLGNLPRSASGVLPDDLAFSVCRLGDSGAVKPPLRLPFGPTPTAWLPTIPDENF